MRAFLRRLFSVRIGEISGVGSAARTAAPADGLHRPRPTTSSLTEPGGEPAVVPEPPDEPDPSESPS
ncbi:MAG TPA: hypothetical protein VFU36_04330 [Jatrophihabitans sp.]|nr:hypothetical protein [Jatrophihabitans sp.]